MSGVAGAGAAVAHEVRSCGGHPRAGRRVATRRPVAPAFR